MLWRLGRARYDAMRGEGNRAVMRKLVETGPPPGSLAYARDEPVGWISVAPRTAFVRLDTSRVLKPVDSTPVWSISCLYVRGDHRRRGVTGTLIEAAAALARDHAAPSVEGYPVQPSKPGYPVAYAWTGFHDNFTKAGFVEVARRSATRPIMRFDLTR